MSMIVILGGSGYIGTAYRRYLEAEGVEYASLSRAELDYTEPELLAGYLKERGAELVINAAGYTGKPNVDACERDKARCLAGNAVLPGLVAEACEAAGVPWGHVSSGCIYSGRRSDGEGFTEEDEPNFSFRKGPCSFYSGSKALGEEVLAGRDGVYVWRLRIPFDHMDHPRNYLTKLMRYERLLDVENSVTHLGDFVRATLECAEKGVAFGVYNVTNPGSITTREVVGLIQESGVCGREPEFFESEEAFMREAVITPRSNCVLDCSKLTAAGIEMRPVREAIRSSLASWQPQA